MRDPTPTQPNGVAVRTDAGAVPGMPERESSMMMGVRRTLEYIHEQNASAAINLPDNAGAFPACMRLGLLGNGVPPVGPDANTLRQDVLHACRHNRRTVLITAANAGSIRLFCASHVLDEVAEHSARWASESGVPHRAFLARWEHEYLPLTREVRDGDLRADLLTPVEQQRIGTLRERDPDDVPSAILSILLGAFYMTEDRRALEAVYGAGFDLERHRKWLDVLKAGGDAGALGGVMFAATALPAGAGYGLFTLGKRLNAYSPWILVATGLALGLLATQVSSETWRKTRSGLSDAASAYLYAYTRYMAAFERFRREAAPVPSWGQLAEINDRRLVLARACLYTLARAPRSDLSAPELARALPLLGVGQGEQLVRETMRGHHCFDQPYRGRWQAGHIAQALPGDLQPDPHISTSTREPALLAP